MNTHISTTIDDTQTKKEKIISEVPLAQKADVTLSSIILAGCIALFSVIFLWGFWSRGINALGLNATAGWVLVFFLYFQGKKNKLNLILKNLYWMIPLFGIIIGFTLYENPYLKIINVGLLPLLMVFFCNYTRLKIIGASSWSWDLICKTFGRKISLDAGQHAISAKIASGKNTKDLIKKITMGVGILVLLNIVIIILLSSADSNFKDIISRGLDLLSIQSVLKISTALLALVFFVSLKINWDSRYEIQHTLAESKLDSVVAGIVIGGTLITYLIFIGVQIDAITAYTLPDELRAVVSLVKNGFWQLFAVSLINIGFFFVYFKKTNPIVQNLLVAFIVSSMVILLSAGHKMFIYVYYYGLSYEKFSASYTVLYIGILFTIMLYFSLREKHIDILKISILTALWMYSFLNIFPMETFIFRVNTQISLRDDARILKNQSHILSGDVMDEVLDLKGTDLYIYQDWQAWVNRKEKENKDKLWYEKSLSNF